MRSLSEETRIYQAALEEGRANPEDLELQAMIEDQRREMELAWLEETTSAPTATLGAMKSQYKAALVRFGRVILYGLIGVVVAALPDLVASVPAEYQFIATPIVVALVAGLDKLRRYGTDPGEYRE